MTQFVAVPAGNEVPDRSWQRATVPPYTRSSENRLRDDACVNVFMRNEAQHTEAALACLYQVSVKVARVRDRTIRWLLCTIDLENAFASDIQFSVLVDIEAIFVQE